MSAVLVDWSPCWKDVLQLQQNFGYEIVQFLVEYSPPTGVPASPIKLPTPLLPVHTQIPINHTWPAVGYRVCLMVEFQDGSRQKIQHKNIYSTPLRPNLISFETGTTLLHIVYGVVENNFASQSQYYTYYLEYFRRFSSTSISLNERGTGIYTNNGEKIFFLHTNATSLRIRNLIPDSDYVLRIYSRFFGVQSLEPLQLIFKTKKLDNKNLPYLIPDTTLTSVNLQKSHTSWNQNAISSVSASVTVFPFIDVESSTTPENKQISQLLNPVQMFSPEETGSTVGSWSTQIMSSIMPSPLNTSSNFNYAPRLKSPNQYSFFVPFQNVTANYSVNTPSKLQYAQQQQLFVQKQQMLPSLQNQRQGYLFPQQQQLEQSPTDHNFLITTLSPNFQPSIQITRNISTNYTTITTTPTINSQNSRFQASNTKLISHKIPNESVVDSSKNKTFSQKIPSKTSKNISAENTEEINVGDELIDSFVDNPKPLDNKAKIEKNDEVEIVTTDENVEDDFTEENDEEFGNAAVTQSKRNRKLHTKHLTKGKNKKGKVVDENEDETFNDRNFEIDEFTETSKLKSGESSLEQEFSASKNSRSIQIKKMQGEERIRVEWKLPESALCDEFFFNYTIKKEKPQILPNEKNSKNKTKITDEHTEARTTDYFIIIDFCPDATIKLRISCMFEGVLSPGSWSAFRDIDLRKPQSISNLRVQRVDTDEKYVASVELAFDWPKYHDFYFYNIIVSWALGKNIVGNKHVVIKRRSKVVKIAGLLPAQLYTFTVRNSSRELGLSSPTTGLRQVTPPVITSTLYPGQISSNSINIKFDETDTEYSFDSYEFVFVSTTINGATKNITKNLQKNDRKSFNFNRLASGKTYRFVLYTLFKGLRSRAVIADVTTYPLKVKRFLPVIGPSYVVLHWDPENIPDSFCKYRLSYSARSNNGGEKKSENVEVNGTKRSYRFTKLDYDTYYTFTITVVTGEGESSAASESETVTVGFAGRSRLIPILKRYGSRELSLSFENDRHTFPDLNGVIDNFAIIVTEDVEDAEDGYDLKSWYDVSDFEVRPAYRTSPSKYHPFKRREAPKLATFIIGDEDCDEKRKVDEPYCNGALQSRVEYFVKVRAYSVANVAMETDWISIHGAITEQNRNTKIGSRYRLPCHMYLNGCHDSENGAVIYFNRYHTFLRIISLGISMFFTRLLTF